MNDHAPPAQQAFRRFILRPPALYSWLFRADLRGKAAIDDQAKQRDFLAWWVIFGARQYGQPPRVSDEERALLFAPGLDVRTPGTTGLSFFARCVLRTDNSFTQQCELSGKTAMAAANAFARVVETLLRGAPESVSAADVALLNEPPPLVRQIAQNSKEPGLTWLMIFLWQLHPLARKAFDLGDTASRMRVLLWFYGEGLQESGLLDLLGERPRAWLTMPQGQPPVARAALLLWRTRPTLQKTYDLKTTAGWEGFARWADESRRREPLLELLDATKPSAPPRQASRAGGKKIASLEFGVNLIGCAFGELGIGEDLRMAAAACDAAGIPCSVINIAAGEGLPEADRLLQSRVEADAAELKYPINLFCLSGFDNAIVRLRDGERLFEGRCNIGWWPWELAVWPRNWGGAFEMIDEVWAASTFVQEMYASASGLPVTPMPLPVSVDRVARTSRDALGLPDDRFLFLYVFFNGYLERKNPLAVVEAFHKAFPSRDKSVGLVLKAISPKDNNPQWKALKAACAKDKRITIIDQRLDRPQVLGLIEACDAYVSLHRSEGFGRTLAEAMLFGKPVVGTDYSGSKDFLNAETGFPVQYQRVPVRRGDYPYVEDGEAVWAEPEIAHAAAQMRRARTAGEKSGYGDRVRERVAEVFSPQRIGLLMKARLTEIHEQLKRDGAPR